MAECGVVLQQERSDDALTQANVNYSLERTSLKSEIDQLTTSLATEKDERDASDKTVCALCRRCHVVVVVVSVVVVISGSSSSPRKKVRGGARPRRRGSIDLPPVECTWDVGSEVL